MKTTQQYITQGIKVYEDMDVAQIFKIANKHHDTSYFLSFKPHGELTLVTDGNGNRMDTLKMEIPEALYCIRDDYDEYFATTLMLSHEY